jgi:hypothetical protein
VVCIDCVQRAQSPGGTSTTVFKSIDRVDVLRTSVMQASTPRHTYTFKSAPHRVHATRAHFGSASGRTPLCALPLTVLVRLHSFLRNNSNQDHAHVTISPAVPKHKRMLSPDKSPHSTSAVRYFPAAIQYIAHRHSKSSGSCAPPEP